MRRVNERDGMRTIPRGAVVERAREGGRRWSSLSEVACRRRSRLGEQTQRQAADRRGCSCGLRLPNERASELMLARGARSSVDAHAEGAADG